MVLITNDLVGTSKTNTTTTKWQHKKPKQQQRKVLHVSYVKLNLTTLQPGSTRLLHHLASKWIAPQPHRGLNWGKGTHRKEEKRGRGKGAIILRHFLFYYKGKCIYIAVFVAPHTQSTQVWITQFYLQMTPYLRIRLKWWMYRLCTMSSKQGTVPIQ